MPKFLDQVIQAALNCRDIMTAPLLSAKMARFPTW